MGMMFFYGRLLLGGSRLSVIGDRLSVIGVLCAYRSPLTFFTDYPFTKIVCCRGIPNGADSQNLRHKKSANL